MKRTLWILQDLLAMDSFIIVDMYIFIVIAFLWTPLIKDQILRYVVYKPYLLLLLSSWYMSSGCHTHILYKTVVVGWDGFNVFNAVIEFCWVAIPIRISTVEAFPERCWLRNYYWLHANCVCGIGSMTDFLHMLAMLSDAKMRFGL